MVDILNLFQAVAMYRKLVLKVLDALVGCLAVPDAIAGQDHELNVLVEGLYGNIWERGDHVVIKEPCGLSVLWGCFWLVVEVTNGS